MQTSDRLVTKNSFIQKESILIFYETSEYSFWLVLSQIFMTLLKILFDFCFSSIFSHLGLYSHFHINFRVYADIDTVIFFNNFCSCKNNLTSNFSLLFGFIRNRGCYTPIFVTLFEHISHINEIPWRYNKYFVITQVNNFCIIIRWLHFFIVLVNVGIKRFLYLKIIQHSLIGFIICVFKLKRVNKNICFSNLWVFTI